MHEVKRMGVENNCAYLATLQLKLHNFHWSFYALSWLVSLLTNMKTRRGFVSTAA